MRTQTRTANSGKQHFHGTKKPTMKQTRGPSVSLSSVASQHVSQAAEDVVATFAPGENSTRKIAGQRNRVKPRRSTESLHATSFPIFSPRLLFNRNSTLVFALPFHKPSTLLPVIFPRPLHTILSVTSAPSRVPVTTVVRCVSVVQTPSGDWEHLHSD
jgi:hypothetical protein